MSVRPIDNIINIDNDIDKKYQKRSKSNKPFSNNNPLLHSLTNNNRLVTIA